LSRQAKVGAVFLAFLALLLYLSPTLSKRSEVLGNTYDLVFTQVNGLREGDSVKYSGVNAGQIVGIDFTDSDEKARFGEDGQVVVRIVTDFGLRIPEDSHATVQATMGGLRWVEITPGNSKQALRPGSVSRLLLRPPEPDQFEAALSGLKELNVRTREVRTSIEDPAFRRKVKDLASNARFYSNELRQVSDRAGQQIDGVRRSLDERQQALLQQLDRVDVQVSQARRRTQELVPRVNEQIDAWEARMKDSETDIRGLIDNAIRETDRYRDLVVAADQKLAGLRLNETLRQRVTRLADKSEEIATLAEDLQMISSSPETQAELREMVARYRRQAEELRRNLERWEKAIP